MTPLELFKKVEKKELTPEQANSLLFMLYIVSNWHRKILWKMPCIKLWNWAISGRSNLNDDLWNNKLATVRVWKKH